MSSHKNQENSVIDAFLGLDISSLIDADVESLANPDLEHWEAALPVYGPRSDDDVEMFHEATGGQWMEIKSDVNDDLNFWRQTSPDNKFRCHSNSEMSPFSKMGDSCYLEKNHQDNSTFQQTEDEGVLGLRGLRKLSESLEEGKDGVYDEKDIAEKYEEEQPNIVKNIQHLLEDEESDQVDVNIFDKSDKAKTNLDEVKVDIPEEWKSPFPSPPALETDCTGRSFCFSPQTPDDSLLVTDPPCFYSPTSSPYNSSIFPSDPSCFYSPSPSPNNSLGFTSDPSCSYSPCSSPQTPSYSQPISGYSSPVKDQSWQYTPPPPPLSYIETNERSRPPFSLCPPPPAYGPAPPRSSQLVEQCGSRIVYTSGPSGRPVDTSGPGGRPVDTSGPGGRPVDTSGHGGRPVDTTGPGGRPVDTSGHGGRPVDTSGPSGRPVETSGPAAPQLKRNPDFTVYVHPTNAVPSYATAARLNVPTNYAKAARRSTSIPRLNSLKNLPAKAQICGFCRQNGERKEVFRGHNKADENGAVTCPYLASHVCEICGATGQNAHTKTYCPKLPKKQVPLPVALKNTKRKSDGKLRK